MVMQTIIFHSQDLQGQNGHKKPMVMVYLNLIISYKPCHVWSDFWTLNWKASFKVNIVHNTPIQALSAKLM